MKKEQLPLIIGLAIPVLLIAVLAAIIYVPRLYVKPSFDFVYAVGSYPVSLDSEAKTRVEYSVVNDRLKKTTSPAEVSLDPNDKYYYGLHVTTPPDFYRYDVTEHKSISLSEEEILQLTLDPNEAAPDGFKMSYGQEGDDIFSSLFGGRDYAKRILVKGTVSVPLNVVSGSDRYGSEFHFIGWLPQ